MIGCVSVYPPVFVIAILNIARVLPSLSSLCKGAKREKHHSHSKSHISEIMIMGHNPFSPLHNYIKMEKQLYRNQKQLLTDLTSISVFLKSL